MKNQLKVLLKRLLTIKYFQSISQSETFQPIPIVRSTNDVEKQNEVGLN